jgi:hypothetical protein
VQKAVTGKPSARGVDRRREAANDAALLESVQAGLDGAAGNPKGPGGAEDANVGVVAEGGDEARVEGVDSWERGCIRDCPR